MLNSMSKKKSDLHLELKYSPDLLFYKNDEYYINYQQLICEQSELRP